MSSTFNVAYLSPFDVGDELDSRTNHPEEGGNDMDLTKCHIRTLIIGTFAFILYFHFHTC